LNTCILCLRHVYHHINKYNLTASSFSVQKKYGGDLLSHTVTSEVPSALKGLTSVFGMETGVSPSL
jgi:hypothetical protein